jgi:hypothetical protein
MSVSGSGLGEAGGIQYDTGAGAEPAAEAGADAETTASPVTDRSSGGGGRMAMFAAAFGSSGAAATETSAGGPGLAERARAAGCPFHAWLDTDEPTNLIGVARKALAEGEFGDDSAAIAQALLDEALTQSPRDPDGTINALLGKAHMAQENYGQAMLHLRAALDRNPDDAALKSLLEKAETNVDTRIAQPTMAHDDFDAEALAMPPALHLDAPRDLKGVHDYSPSLLVGLARGLAKAAKKIPAVVLGGVLKIGIAAARKARERDEGPWTGWYEHGYLRATLELASMREDMNEELLRSTYEGMLVGGQAEGQERPEWTERFRTATGAWTTDNPMEGAAGTEFQLQGTESVTDRTNRAGDSSLPSAREVSRAMLETVEGEEQKTVPFLNNLTMAWIQFMSHDWMSHGANMTREAYEIPLADDDPLKDKYGQDSMFVRKSQPNPTREDGSNIYLNEVTHWWDGSQIYGSDQETQNRLRMGADGQFLPDGKLRLDDKDRLPVNPETGVEDTGFTENWWAGLSLMHTVFARNHNWICDELKKEYPAWGTDEIFHTARLINSASMAKIHTVEWTPAVLPNPTLTRAMGTNWWGLLETATKPFSEREIHSSLDLGGPLLDGLVGGEREDHGAPYGFSEKFVEVYRLHAGLPNDIEIREVGESDVAEKIGVDSVRARGSRILDEEYGLDTLLNSFGNQHMTALVNNNYPKFMSELSIDGQSVVDLGAIDILRARERGVPQYNQFREEMGLKPIKSFSDLGVDAKTLAKLEELYGKDGVDKMDLLVGTLCEAHRPEFFGFGETLFQVFIQMASRRLQADPFYTDKFNEDYYTKTGMRIVQETSMKEVLLRTCPELAESGLMGVNNAFEPWGTTAESHPEEHPLTALGHERY